VRRANGARSERRRSAAILRRLASLAAVANTFLTSLSPSFSVSSLRSSSQGGNFLDAYYTSLYWALLVVIGNSVEPTNRVEYAFSTLVTLVGMLVFAVIIGSSSSLITSLDSEGEAR
jgi:hypothetical protein